MICSAGGVTRRTTKTLSAPVEAGPADRNTLLGMTLTMPDAPELPVTCRATRLEDGGAHQEDERFTEELFTLKVKIRHDAPFHFEAALLLPFVFGGDRTISRTPLVGTNEQTLHTVQDLQVSVSLALHYFPFGIYGNGPWAEEPRGGLCHSTHPARLLPLACRYLLNPIGVELGGRVDLASWQIGLAFEPVRGAALSMGVSALKGDFYRPGFREGMLFSGQDSLPVDRRYMFRPYLGVSISPEILGLLIDVFGKVQKLAPPTQSSPSTETR